MVNTVLVPVSEWFLDHAPPEVLQRAVITEARTRLGQDPNNFKVLNGATTTINGRQMDGYAIIRCRVLDQPDITIETAD